MFSFLRRRQGNFPAGRKDRLDKIMQVHLEVAGNNILRSKSTLDTLLEQIDGEKDTFILDSYVIYYIGFYKPFESGNEATAKILADGILADGGWIIPQERYALAHFDEICMNMHDIESVVEWQKAHVMKL